MVTEWVVADGIVLLSGKADVILGLYCCLTDGACRIGCCVEQADKSIQNKKNIVLNKAGEHGCRIVSHQKIK